MRAQDRSSRPASARTNATYVYCLVQSAKPPSARGVPASVPGAGAPRLLAIDRDVWAVVADAPLDRFAAEVLQQELQDVEAISRHALAHAVGHRVLLPPRAGHSAEIVHAVFQRRDGSRSTCAAGCTALKRMFAALRGLEEWGVRIFAGEAEAESARTVDSGRDYLQVKKRLHDQTAAPSRATVRAVNGAAQVARANRIENAEGSISSAGRGRPYVAGASFLVKAKRRNAWKNACRKARRGACRDGSPARHERARGLRIISSASRWLAAGNTRRLGDWLFPNVTRAAQDRRAVVAARRARQRAQSGAVLNGDIVLGVANVDLIYAKLSVLLAALDKVTKHDPVFKPSQARSPRRRQAHEAAESAERYRVADPVSIVHIAGA